MVRITVHGGASEIGGNKVLVEDGTSRLMLDFGSRMGFESTFFSEYLDARTHTQLRDRLAIGALPKIDGIYRDDHASPRNAGLLDAAPGARQLRSDSRYLRIPGLMAYEKYLEAHRAPFLDGVLISHAHMDHTGDLPSLHPAIPVFSSETTKALMLAIDELSKTGVEASGTGLCEFGLQGESASHPGAITVKKGEKIARPLMTLKPFQPTPIGSFRVTMVPVDHSVQGAASFLLETSKGRRILYTGDIRFHGRHGPSMAEYAAEVGRVDVMLCEGTRVDSDSVLTEDDVVSAISREIAQTKGLVLVDFSWKDTTRYETMLEAARRNGRTLVVSSRLAYVLRKLGRHLAEDARVFLPRTASATYSPGDYAKAKHAYGYIASGKDWVKDATHYENGLVADDIRLNPGGHVLMMSFYEMNALFDLADDHGKIPNSRMIKAVCEPFCEDMELDEERHINWLEQFGIAFEEEPGGAPCPACGTTARNRAIRRNHVSGHASGAELAELIRLVNPAVVVPMHTNEPSRFAAMLAGTGIAVREPRLSEALEF